MRTKVLLCVSLLPLPMLASAEDKKQITGSADHGVADHGVGSADHFSEVTF